MKRALLAAILLTATAHVGAEAPAGADDELRGYLLAALRSPAGRADGVLTGRVPTRMQSLFTTSAPLRVAVSTLRRYREAGCARLNVRFSQEAVVESRDAPARDKVFAVQLNYCLDGRPPKRLD